METLAGGPCTVDDCVLITQVFKGLVGYKRLNLVFKRVEQFLDKKILYGPAKAANAGGVATSGLEMSQNSMMMSWTREEVDQRLHDIMVAIHQQCYDAAEEYGQPGNLVMGANIAGFVKVADAMLDQGLV